MDTDLLLVLFIGFAALVIAFAILYILFEMIRDTHKTRVATKQAEANQAIALAQLQQQNAQQAPVAVQVNAQPVQSAIHPQVAQPSVIVIENGQVQQASDTQTQPVKVEEVKEEVKQEQREVTFKGKDGRGVTFNASQILTHEEKYAHLDEINKSYFDQIVNYASKYNGLTVFKNTKYEEYKIASYRLVRLLIKRGVVIAEFVFANSDFKNYTNENKVAVKDAATSIKVVDEDSLKVVFDSIDLAYKHSQEQIEYKKELAKEKRRAKREQQKSN